MDEERAHSGRGVQKVYSSGGEHLFLSQEWWVLSAERGEGNRWEWRPEKRFRCGMMMDLL